jgi:hypothetical protein
MPREDTETVRHGGDHVKMDAEIGVMLLKVKECLDKWKPQEAGRILS